MSKKKAPKKEQPKQKRRSTKDFFQADWNDDVYIQRTISKQGKLGGRRLG